MPSPLNAWVAACGCTSFYTYDERVPVAERVHVGTADPRSVWCARHRHLGPVEQYEALQAESAAEQARLASEADITDQ